MTGEDGRISRGRAGSGKTGATGGTIATVDIGSCYWTAKTCWVAREQRGGEEVEEPETERMGKDGGAKEA